MGIYGESEITETFLRLTETVVKPIEIVEGVATAPFVSNMWPVPLVASLLKNLTALPEAVTAALSYIQAVDITQQLFTVVSTLALTEVPRSVSAMAESSG